MTTVREALVGLLYWEVLVGTTKLIGDLYILHENIVRFEEKALSKFPSVHGAVTAGETINAVADQGSNGTNSRHDRSDS